MSNIKERLDYYADLYNRPEFIADDPISIPHAYSKNQNIEIAAFMASIFAWGQRKTIIKSSRRFLELMGSDPHDFIINHTEKQRVAFLEFKHRTFQPTDAIAFLEFLQSVYRNHSTMEDLFLPNSESDFQDVENALVGFQEQFMSLSCALPRTRKHIASPARNSTCKRLNMFLRWMVRKDDKGVDFGLWNRIKPSQLFIPLDVHVERIARNMGLLERKQRDWKSVLELTDKLKNLDPDDPVKYDFALFGMSIAEKKQQGPI